MGFCCLMISYYATSMTFYMFNMHPCTTYDEGIQGSDWPFVVSDAVSKLVSLYRSYKIKQPSTKSKVGLSTLG